jgi:hypothetical protein
MPNGRSKPSRTSSSRPIVSGTLKKMKTMAASATMPKEAHINAGPRAWRRDKKEMETTPARMRVVKRASDMALARRRLGKTSVPTWEGGELDQRSYHEVTSEARQEGGGR